MKKQLFFLLFLFLFVSTLSIAQSSLDSLRLVLPVGHNEGINSVVFSPDGELALTASYDKTSRIFEVATGKELQVLGGHKNHLESAVFSPNGLFVITASSDTVHIWDVKTGNVIQSFSGHFEEVRSAVFSMNGKLIIIASGKIARIYDVDTGKNLQVLTGHKKNVVSAIFSPNGKIVLTTSLDNTARIYEVATGKKLRVLRGHKNYINSAWFSAEGKLIITASTDMTVRIWDVSTGKKLQVLRGHTDEVYSAVFSPDGTLALTASDSTARIYEVATGKELHVLSGHTDEVKSAVFSPDGKLALTASDDATARIWEVSSGKLLHILIGHTSIVSSAVISADGKLALTSSGDNTTRIFEVATGKELRVFKGYASYVYSAKFSPDGKIVILASGDNTARIYEVATGIELQVLTGHINSVFSAEFSPDGKWALTSSADQTARVYEVATGLETQILKGHTGWINSAVFSSDGKWALTASYDSTARIYEVATGRTLEVLRGHEGWVENAVFSPDNKFVLTVAWDGTAHIYDASNGILLVKLNSYEVNHMEFSQDGKLVLTAEGVIYEVSTGNELQVLGGVEGFVYSADFSADDKLVLLSCYDNTTRIYEVATGKELQVLTGHSDWIGYSAFSSDGKKVITASRDNTVRIYEVATGKELIVLKGHTAEVYSALSNPEGNLLLTIGGDFKTILWDIETGKQIFNSYQLQNNNYLVKLPNSPYYMCSKDASKMLHYVTPSLKVIGFEQLDPVYNRPDIVLDSIGKYFGNSDGGMIDEYRKSWEKRIDRLGLDKEKLGKGEIAVPNAEIVDADNIAFENKVGKLNIRVSANDPKYPLRRFNVFVNEVPLYGSAGISIAHLKKQVWDTTVSVPLSLGENKIQVSVMNELGLENFKYPTYVNYTPENNIVAKTHYIGIGVNEFKESSHNLKYCVKDVRDLAKAFATQNKNIDTLLFTDKQVTKENILALKDYLNKTGVNDKVIISCSSHGLLDDSLNFYLAMHDVDFNNPKARGLKYEALESLLDGIPARQKLLLLDACNSGENDKTEILKQELATNQHKMDAKTIEGAKGYIKVVQEENKSNFKKMNELFVNVRNNTGSVIISAAGGQESALEAIKVDGETIKNGAFTYSILECLKQNEGKELKVNALKQYAEKRVEEITNGKQKPTSRQETMEIDWGVR
jgi:WD40 repeat protein